MGGGLTGLQPLCLPFEFVGILPETFGNLDIEDCRRGRTNALGIEAKRLDGTGRLRVVAFLRHLIAVSDEFQTASVERPWFGVQPAAPRAAAG